MITLHHHRVGRVFASCDERPHALYDVTRMYIAGVKKPPMFPLPALIVTFDYWSAEDTDNGKPLIYMMEHHRPGRWRQVAKFGEGENEI